VSEISTSRTESPSLRLVWRDYLQFVRWPSLPLHRTGFSSDAFQATAALFLLDVAAMAILACVALLIVSLGGEMPRHALDGIKLSAPLIVMIVVVGPVVEEAVFRGWLTGTPRSLSLYGTFIIVAAAVMLTGSLDRTSAVTLFIALIVGIAGSLQWLSNDVPVRRYSRAFPWLFWVSSLAFALVHLTNLTIGHNRFAVLWVAPQLISGTIFGYARVRLGMWSNVVLHMAHNAVMILVAISLGMGR